MKRSDSDDWSDELDKKPKAKDDLAPPQKKPRRKTMQRLPKAKANDPIASDIEMSRKGPYGALELETAPSSPNKAGTLRRVAAQDRDPVNQTLKCRGRGKARLPEKLMEYLNGNILPEVLWWLPGEEAFALGNPIRVQKELLDVYFRQTKLPSFIRSLNRWGFRRMFAPSLPKDATGFHHKLFKKSDPMLVRQMELSSYTPLAAAAAAVATSATAHREARTGSELGTSATAEVRSTSTSEAKSPATSRQQPDVARGTSQSALWARITQPQASTNRAQSLLSSVTSPSPDNALSSQYYQQMIAQLQLERQSSARLGSEPSISQDAQQIAARRFSLPAAPLAASLTSSNVQQPLPQRRSSQEEVLLLRALQPLIGNAQAQQISAARPAARRLDPPGSSFPTVSQPQIRQPMTHQESLLLDALLPSFSSIGSSTTASSATNSTIPSVLSSQHLAGTLRTAAAAAAASGQVQPALDPQAEALVAELMRRLPPSGGTATNQPPAAAPSSAAAGGGSASIELLRRLQDAEREWQLGQLIRHHQQLLFPQAQHQQQQTTAAAAAPRPRQRNAGNQSQRQDNQNNSNPGDQQSFPRNHHNF